MTGDATPDLNFTVSCPKCGMEVEKRTKMEAELSAYNHLHNTGHVSVIMAKIKRVTFIHPYDPDKYKDVYGGRFLEDDLSVSILTKDAPNWEQRGMAVIVSTYKETLAFDGIVKKVKTVSNKKYGRIYECR